MSFWNMVWVRNVFLKYGLGAKRLSEIWFGCETSSWTMKTGAKRLSYLWGGGETSFLSMSWGRNVSLKNGANWLWGEKSVYPTDSSDLTSASEAPGSSSVRIDSFDKWVNPADPNTWRPRSLCQNQESFVQFQWVLLEMKIFHARRKLFFWLPFFT